MFDMYYVIYILMILIAPEEIILYVCRVTTTLQERQYWLMLRTPIMIGLHHKIEKSIFI